ncbi:hypothetical protein [Natronorubrum aibiense]|uniref:hypothetical protein n=1 Tax=Natronorubrum aibiense TaxID=348826 RepID=UPI00128FBD90|nr:hypothetical protein [Natronorubrum aibiense]
MHSQFCNLFRLIGRLAGFSDRFVDLMDLAGDLLAVALGTALFLLEIVDTLLEASHWNNVDSNLEDSGNDEADGRTHNTIETREPDAVW